jgi:hypothetical protein
MLSENYKNALNDFKAQANGNATDLFEGCVTEAQHIYRIIMTEKVTVNVIDEAMLEEFLAEEAEGKADYSKTVDRDGLQYVDIEKDVEVYPCVGNAFLEPIDGQLYRLSSLESKAMLSQLRCMGKLSLITESLQSLAQRVDGTRLQTALPSLCDVKACISLGLVLPELLIEKLKLWETLSCSVINFDFEELKN